jgi:thioredoxin 1
MQLVYLKSIADFNVLLKQESRAILIDFYADSCGPCKQIAPFFEQLSNSEISKYVCFVKADVDEVGDLAEHLGVSAMPTFLAFKKELKVGELVGANKDKLTNLVKEIASL